jgi:hypothetical protein
MSWFGDLAILMNQNYTLWNVTSIGHCAQCGACVELSRAIISKRAVKQAQWPVPSILLNIMVFRICTMGM